jgi:hypothetical protein
MTVDLDKLAELARAALDEKSTLVERDRAAYQLRAAANPAAVLALVERVRAAEGEAAQEGDFLETMRAARAELEAKGVHMNAAEFLRERDEDSRVDLLEAIVRDLAAAFHHHDSDPNQRGAPCRLCLGVQGDHREECPGRRAVEATKP